jgi:hypothetical protein
MDKITCSQCALVIASRSCCLSAQKGYSCVCSFTSIRDNGKLLYASEDMFRIIKEADKSLRKQLISGDGPIKGVTSKTTLLVTRDVLQAIGLSVFPSIWQHSIDTHCLSSADDHGTQIVKEACKIFCKTIFHHHEKIVNERYVQNNTGSSRHKLSKTILFMHQ